MEEYILIVRLLFIVIFLASFLYLALSYQKVYKIMSLLRKNFGGYFFNLLPANSDFFRVILVLKQDDSKLTYLEKKILIRFVISFLVGTLSVILLIIIGFI